MVVGPGFDLTILHVECIVVLAAQHGAGCKSCTEFQAFHAGDSEDGCGKAVFDAVKHGIPDSCWQADGSSLYHAAHGILIQPGMIDGIPHQLALLLIQHGKFSSAREEQLLLGQIHWIIGLIPDVFHAGQMGSNENAPGLQILLA